MTLGLIKGMNAMGHAGWITVRCRVCWMKLSLTGYHPGTRRTEPVYACPNCAKDLGAYFCRADAKALKYRCPFCGSELSLVSPITEREV